MMATNANQPPKDPDKILVEFIWTNALPRQDYSYIGSFQVEEPNWPRIFVTVPIAWADSHPEESWSDFLAPITKEFITRFNAGEVQEIIGKFEMVYAVSEVHIFKILGYYTVENSETVFRDSHLLTAEEFSAFIEARDKIAAFYKDVSWFRPIAEKYIRYMDTIREIGERYNRDGHPDYFGQDAINTNSIFNDWLTSITSFLNHMEKRLKTRDRKLSYWNKFDHYLAEQHATNVSYRFLQELRNYIQHQAPPLHISFRGRLDENDNSIHQTNIFCSRDELLKNTRWEPKLKEEIKKMADEIEITPHVSGMMDSLTQILIKHIQDEFSYLGDSARYVHELLSKIPEGSDRGVYEIKFLDNQVIGMSAYVMYSKIAKLILDKDLAGILKASHIIL